VLAFHHAKKGAGRARAGQALRGSSEFHAWGDSNLYLRRDGDDLSLSVEHRAAPSIPSPTAASCWPWRSSTDKTASNSSRAMAKGSGTQPERLPIMMRKLGGG
jgi:hypothetical protein